MTTANCLFNLASIVLTGTEALSATLRLVTVADLFAYSEYYTHYGLYMAFLTQGK